MPSARSPVTGLALLTVLVFSFQLGLEGLDVRVEHDKAFDFASVRTWGWHPDRPGNVIMARTQEDDGEAMKRRADPVIRDAVATEMQTRGLQPATAQPDLALTYYLLLSTNMSGQTMGQFLPATAWGLPLFAPATQSMKVMNKGALVLDLSSKNTVVWRGVAEAKVSFEIDDKKREALLREGVRDLLKRYPPKR